MRSITRLPALIALPLLLSGCVAWEIRDEVRKSNARLDRVESTLNSTNEALAKANEELVQVQTEISGLRTTNTLLADTQARLALLQSMATSLHRLDEHLANLRKVLASLDSAIPFFSLGAEAPSEPVPPGPPTTVAVVTPAADAAGRAGAPAEAASPVQDAPAGAAAGTPAAASGPATATAPTAPARDSIMGTWVGQYPDRGVALVFLDGSRYLMQSAGAGRSVEAGTWKRDGKQVTLVPDQLPFSPAPTAKDGAKDKSRPATAPPNPAPPAPMSLEIVQQTVRSLTLQDPQRGLLVFGRP